MANVVELDPAAEALWRQVMASWEDETAHDHFVQHCFREGRLAAAGACYRRFADDHAGDPRLDTARRMQERVVFLSMQALLPTASSRGAGRRVWQSPWFTVVLLLGAALGALLGLLAGARR